MTTQTLELFADGEPCGPVQLADGAIVRWHPDAADAATPRAVAAAIAAGRMSHTAQTADGPVVWTWRFGGWTGGADPWRDKPPGPMPVAVSMAWGEMPRVRGAEDAIGLSVHDSFRWSHEAFGFRVRFAATDDCPLPERWSSGGPSRYSEQAARTGRLISERVLPLVRGPHGHATHGLYLADVEDVRRLVIALRPHVASIQTRAQYEEAARLARAIFQSNADYVAMLENQGTAVDDERRQAAALADAWDRGETVA